MLPYLPLVFVQTGLYSVNTERGFLSGLTLNVTHPTVLETSAGGKMDLFRFTD